MALQRAFSQRWSSAPAVEAARCPVAGRPIHQQPAARSCAEGHKAPPGAIGVAIKSPPRLPASNNSLPGRRRVAAHSPHQQSDRVELGNSQPYAGPYGRCAPLVWCTAALTAVRWNVNAAKTGMVVSRPQCRRGDAFDAALEHRNLREQVRQRRWRTAVSRRPGCRLVNHLDLSSPDRRRSTTVSRPVWNSTRPMPMDRWESQADGFADQPADGQVEQSTRHPSPASAAYTPRCAEQPRRALVDHLKPVSSALRA